MKRASPLALAGLLALAACGGDPANNELAAIDNELIANSVDPALTIILSVDRARSLVDYRADEALQNRIEQLARKCNEGDLTEHERSEYDGYVRANNFVAILQAKARQVLADADA